MGIFDKATFDKAAERARKLADDASRRGGSAGEFAHKAGPYAERGIAAAGDFAERVRPYAERAGGYAAKGLDGAAKRVNDATGGKYSSRIDGVTKKVGSLLDPEHKSK